MRAFCSFLASNRARKSLLTVQVLSAAVLMHIQSNGELRARGDSVKTPVTERPACVCVAAVGSCRAEPRQWTPAPGTSELGQQYQSVIIRILNESCSVAHSCLSPSYYVNGRDTSLEDFLNPDILDTLAVKIKEVLKVTTCSFTCGWTQRCRVFESTRFSWFRK